MVFTGEKSLQEEEEKTLSAQKKPNKIPLQYKSVAAREMEEFRG